MTKPLDYQALMALDEAFIQASFPFGAIESKKGWRPAEEGERGDKWRSQKDLLKDKRKRQEPDRFLARSGGSYTSDVRSALGKETHYAGQAELGGREPEPAVIDGFTQKRQTKEALERDQQRASERPLWQLLRDLEEAMSERQKQSIRRRIEAARRAAA